MVVAPSMIPRKPGERIKTDRRDSEKLAVLHRSGDLTPVWVPDTTHEALRDLVRARVDASMQLMRARQQLLAFLLRHARSYPTGKHWTQRHRAWLAGQIFQEPAHNVVFQDYLEAVWAAQNRRDSLVKKISSMVESWSLGPLVQALRGLRGIDLVSAATFIASTGRTYKQPSMALLCISKDLGLYRQQHGIDNGRSENIQKSENCERFCGTLEPTTPAFFRVEEWSRSRAEELLRTCLSSLAFVSGWASYSNHQFCCCRTPIDRMSTD